MYKYRFPIGDWSDDGHGRCEWFLINGNKSIEEVRDAHSKCKEILGFRIGQLCCEYGEFEIEEDIKNILISKNIVDKDIFDDMYPSNLLKIWLNILNYIDPELKLKKEEDHPAFISFGRDPQGRDLGTPGYGLF